MAIAFSDVIFQCLWYLQEWREIPTVKILATNVSSELHHMTTDMGRLWFSLCSSILHKCVCLMSYKMTHYFHADSDGSRETKFKWWKIAWHASLTQNNQVYITVYKNCVFINWYVTSWQVYMSEIHYYSINPEYRQWIISMHHTSYHATLNEI